jgi:hypothetical protein
VVIAVERFGCGLDVGGAQLLNEDLGARDRAEDDRARRHMLGKNPPAHVPYELAVERELFSRGVTGQHDRVSAAQVAQGLAQAAGWEKTVFGILRSEQDDIEIAGQGAVLEAVVEKMKLWSEFGFGQAARFEATLAYEDGHLQALRDEQRLVAEIARRAGGIDGESAARGSAVAAGKHVEPDSAGFE